MCNFLVLIESFCHEKSLKAINKGDTVKYDIENFRKSNKIVRFYYLVDSVPSINIVTKIKKKFSLSKMFVSYI